MLLYRSLVESIDEVARARREARGGGGRVDGCDEGRRVQALIEKAEVLVEALPYIQRFADKTIVIKYGGHAHDGGRAARLLRPATWCS